MPMTALVMFVAMSVTAAAATVFFRRFWPLSSGFVVMTTAAAGFAFAGIRLAAEKFCKIADFDHCRETSFHPIL